MKKKVTILTIILLPLLVQSQGLFEIYNKSESSSSNKPNILNGHIKAQTWLKNSDNYVTNAFGEVSLQFEVNKNFVLAKSDIRIRKGYIFNNDSFTTEIKEAWAGIRTPHFDISLGEQIINWGRTDGFNPTNNITPTDYFFLSPNPDDQKVSNFLLKTKIRLAPSIDAEIIVIPIFRPSIYRYELLYMGDNITFKQAVSPIKKVTNSSLATKLNFEYPGIGFSISWFSGFDPFYGFDLQKVDFSKGTPEIVYIPAYYKKNTLGTDFAIPIGNVIIRSEAALNLCNNETQEMYIPKNNMNYVAAIEFNVSEVTAILQYIGNYTLNFQSLEIPELTNPLDPLAQIDYIQKTIRYESELMNRKIFHQQESTNNGLSLTLSGNFAYETLNAEISCFYDFTSEEVLIKPQASYKLSDALSITAGYHFMRGEEKSLFGYAAPIMNGGFIELKINY